MIANGIVSSLSLALLWLARETGEKQFLNIGRLSRVE